MKENVGTWDKILRVVGVAGIVALNVTVSMSPVFALVLGVIGVILLFTVVTGVCPLYRKLGLSTSGKKTKR